MPRGTALNNRLAARIKSSAVSLDVIYPRIRVATPIAVPTTAPVSPLTGPKTTATLVPGTTTPAKPTVKGIPCLWLDATANAMQSRERINTDLDTGWRAGAEAMARVLIADAALYPDAPYAGNVFDGSDSVVAHGKMWKVVAVEPIGHSFTAPTTYAVWLKGTAIS